MFDPILQALAPLLATGGWVAPLLAVVAGAITSLMPCSLSTLPLIIGYVGGVGAGARQGFRMALAFAVGMALSTTALGAGAALLGKLLHVGGGSWYYLVLGVLMVLMALQLFGVFEFIPSTYATRYAKRRGVTGALVAGVLGGVFASPCATPVLVVLLGLVAAQDSIVWGITLLLCYAIGQSILVLVVGTSVGIVRQITTSARYGRISNYLQIVLGVATLALGLYLLYLGF